MSRLFQCDYCGAVFDSRDSVALIDIEFGGNMTEKVHGCPDHIPDGLFPAADGTPIDAEPPVITAEEAADLGVLPRDLDG